LVGVMQTVASAVSKNVQSISAFVLRRHGLRE
jgi:hypothetical protein